MSPDRSGPQPLLSVEQALDLLASDNGNVGIFAARPMVAVGLKGDPVERELAARAARLPCVFVGVSVADDPRAVTAELDVMLSAGAHLPRPWVGCHVDTAPVLADLESAVLRTPTAAIVLVESLRLTASRPIDDALVVESLAYGILQSGPEHERWLASRSPWVRPRLPDPPLLLERAGDVLTLTLNRPRLRNSFDTSMREALIEALDLVGSDESIERVILQGAGPAFCIGGDLREFGSRPDPSTAHLVRMTRSAAPCLAACASKLTADKFHGHCIGAGIEIAAFASLVIAAPNTTIRLPELTMGLIPGAGGTVSLPSRIGRSRTAFLALTGTPLGVETAHEWGLVDVVEA